VKELILSGLRQPDDVSRQSTNLLELTTGEKLDFWNTEGSGSPDFPAEQPKDSILLMKEKEAPDTTLFTETRAFLIESKAYQWLLGRIRTSLVLTTRRGTDVELIRNVIIDCLNRHDSYGTFHTATFLIFWSPLRFLREQNYQDGEDQAIGEVITVTGSAIDAQAMTCAQYMHQTWPLTGNETLRALQAAMAEKLSHRHHCISSYPRCGSFSEC
jgi:hypothetical protein